MYIVLKLYNCMRIESKIFNFFYNLKLLKLIIYKFINKYILINFYNIC